MHHFFLGRADKNVSLFFAENLAKKNLSYILLIGNASTGLVSIEEGPKAFLPFLPQTEVLETCL